MTENTNSSEGVIVYSMSDMPLGFGVAAKVFNFQFSLLRRYRSQLHFILRNSAFSSFFNFFSTSSESFFKSTSQCRNADPTAIVVLHQSDLGEYLRDEETLT